MADVTITTDDGSGGEEVAFAAGVAVAEAHQQAQEAVEMAETAAADADRAVEMATEVAADTYDARAAIEELRIEHSAQMAELRDLLIAREETPVQEVVLEPTVPAPAAEATPESDTSDEGSDRRDAQSTVHQHQHRYGARSWFGHRED